MRRLLPALLALVVLAPATAAAAPAVSGEFPTAGTLSDVPKHLTLGSDGNIWVVLDNDKLARVTPGGAVTEFATSNLAGSVGITTGPDGNLWVTGTNQVVKVVPSNPTVGVPTTITQIGTPQAITTGPDGNLWTASDGNVIKIPPGDPSTKTPFPVVTGARGIARGNDGQLWVADFGGQRIASVTTAGAATYYPTAATGGPMQVAAGLGTQIGFTDPIVNPQEIGRIIPGGTAQRTVVSGGSGDPTGIVFGNDGAYWIARFGGNDLVRFTPAGLQTTLSGFSASAGPRQITKGPGDTLWVGLETAKKVARVTGVAAPPPAGAGGGTTTADTTRPSVSGLSMTDRTVVVGPSATPIVAAKTGTTIRYTLSEKATVKLRFERKLAGRRRGRKCVKPRRSLRRKRRCTRHKHAGTLTRSSKQGKNSVKFSGRIGRKALKRGRYRLVVTATDTAGNKSKAKRLSFRVVKPKRKRHR
jgi:virginiamycin B lyase